ncbi:MAG: radical SAM protein [archaeon]|nr:radical SAM protein [archaeon]
MTPDKIRVSIGSASKLGLKKIKMDVQPSNCHLLTYYSGGCQANCSFCPQSRYTFEKLKSQPDSQEFLSRVTWPSFSFQEILSIFEKDYSNFSTQKDKFQRICLQSLKYPGFEEDIKNILEEISKITNIPISIAIPPVSKKLIKQYKDSGAERICFAIDAPTEKLFDNIKGKGNSGPYKWNEHNERLDNALKIFGKGYVTTHLIIGVGENEFEALNFISEMKLKGINTGIFAFTPLKNTKSENLKRPEMIKFRKIQLGKYLIDTKKKAIDDFKFDNNGKLSSLEISSNELEKFVDKSIPFQTSGCPGCNRPYYTSTPREEQYNFPEPINKNVKQIIINELLYYCKKTN